MRTNCISRTIVATYCLANCPLQTPGADRIVATTAEFSSALAAAAAGDRILLQPGVYAGGHYRENLQQVTIRSVDPNNQAIIDGGSQRDSAF